ncbi:MAG: alpha-1,3-galactosidase B [Bacteroidales bacterium]|nr:alpha-1,3-galactosidase B [Bacteroidales bacterium]
MKILMLIMTLMLSISLNAKKIVVDISEAPYFFLPDVNNKDNASRLNEILSSIKSDVDDCDKVIIKFKKARYDFYPHDAQQREYYVSNHDQNQPKIVGICLEEWNNLTIDGNGSEFVFHGQMLPLAVVNSNNIFLKNFSIDFENPHIAQVEVLNNADNEGITFRVEPWVNYRINENGLFETYGEGWKYQQYTGIAFEKESRHIVYQTSDLWIDTKDVKEVGERQLHAPNWKDKRLKPGTIVAMRTWQRPAPGIFLDHSNDTYINNVTVHYAEGMGLLAQRCSDIRLNRFNVCLKENDDRYFTTQADATHFSQCKGMIRSEHGLYEGMMDDAINVHGIYLKVKQRLDDNSLICSYEHNQAWGFAWGDKGDSVCFVMSKTMEMLNHINIIKEIKPYDKEIVKGSKEFLITFEDKLSEEIQTELPVGIENLSWTPQVIFSHNVVRNNRARGALFSSPLRTVCKDNIFDHTSGTAILLCGDCNGWYESGAVRDLLIKNNTFINALTNMFQFTNAVISIYPEIPDLENQTSYFHGGKEDAIVIEKNHFITFDKPLLYAKSVDGLIFRKNKVTRNNDYEPFHWNQKEIFLEKVKD